jgi:hypothetical protein
MPNVAEETLFCAMATLAANIAVERSRSFIKCSFSLLEELATGETVQTLKCLATVDWCGVMPCIPVVQHIYFLAGLLKWPYQKKPGSRFRVFKDLHVFRLK